MKKMKFTQKVALILLFACVFALLAGCTNPATPTDPTVTDPTITDPTDPTTGAEPVLFGGATDFTADLFAKFVGFSRAYSLKITVSDGKICVDDTIYSKVNYVDNPGVIFYDAGLYSYSDQELADGILERINTCKKCYILETEKGGKMAVYDIDGIYYFMRIGDAQVGFIHYFKPEIGG